MIRTAVEALAASSEGDAGILAVTVLTSLDEARLEAVGFSRGPAEHVTALARLAAAAGAEGVVCAVPEVGVGKGARSRSHRRHARHQTGRVGQRRSEESGHPRGGDRGGGRPAGCGSPDHCGGRSGGGRTVDIAGDRGCGFDDRRKSRWLGSRFVERDEDMAQPPQLTDEQRAAALAKAAEARRVRAEAKELLKTGSLRLSELFEKAESDELLAGLKVERALAAMPGTGKIKAKRLMESVGIAENRRIRGLGDKQKEALLAEFS